MSGQAARELTLAFYGTCIVFGSMMIVVIALSLIGDFREYRRIRRIMCKEPEEVDHNG